MSDGTETAEILSEDTGICLRGEDSLNKGLVDQAVNAINHIHAAKGLETAREMGNYLLELFFDGDLESFRAKGKKHVSFRALAQRTTRCGIHWLCLSSYSCSLMTLATNFRFRTTAC